MRALDMRLFVRLGGPEPSHRACQMSRGAKAREHDTRAAECVRAHLSAERAAACAKQQGLAARRAPAQDKSVGGGAVEAVSRQTQTGGPLRAGLLGARTGSERHSRFRLRRAVACLAFRDARRGARM